MSAVGFASERACSLVQSGQERSSIVSARGAGVDASHPPCVTDVAFVARYSCEVVLRHKRTGHVPWGR